jgi:hypothetical protein
MHNEGRRKRAAQSTESLKSGASDSWCTDTEKTRIIRNRFCFSVILETEHNQLQTNEGSKVATNNYLDGVLAGFGGS